MSEEDQVSAIPLLPQRQKSASYLGMLSVVSIFALIA
jgi:hypothetical protein